MGLSRENKLCFPPTHEQWMRDNKGRIDDYLNSNVDFYSIHYVREIFEQNPWICSVVVSDYVKNCEDINYNRILMENFMLSEGNEVNIVSGSKGTGKTAFAISTIENIADRTGLINKVYIGAPNKELEQHGWETIPSIGQAGMDDFCVQDEAALYLDSRRSMSGYNVESLENIPTIRHTGIRGWMLLTQSTKRSDSSILDYSSTHIIKDYTNAYSLEVERGMVTDDLLFEFMMPRQDYVIKSHKKAWSFVKTGNFNCLVFTPLVSWYNDKVGKAFDRFESEKEAMEWATVLIEGNYDIVFIQKTMKVKGFNKSKDYWLDLKDKVTGGNGVSASKKTICDLKGIKGLLDDDETKAYIESLKIKDKEKKRRR